MSTPSKSSQHIEDAQRVAHSIGIPHFVKDFEELFQKEVIDDFLQNSSKPLLSTKFDGFIDTVGGDILAQGLKQLKYDGVATCCGLTASSDLNINVFPFILRGVRLIGIDSVECSLEKKHQAWNNLSGILTPGRLFVRRRSALCRRHCGRSGLCQDAFPDRSSAS